MKKFFTKTLMACAVTAAVGFGGSAMAQSTQQFAPFTINPNLLDVNGIAPFDANLINGGYNERLTFSSASTFDVSLWWNAGQYGSIQDGRTVYSKNGLGDAYGLYVLYTGQGTFSGNTLSYSPGGSFSVWLDKNDDSSFSFSGLGGAPVNVGSASDDVRLGSGTPQSGTGQILADLCPPGDAAIGCGFFRGSTDLSLTTDGSQFFVAPTPFYSLSFQTGQFNNLGTGAGVTSDINGSLDISFAGGNAVPEPTSVALIGLGMAGLFFSRRRKQV